MKQKSSTQLTKKTISRLKTGSIITLVLMALPFAFYTYKWFPRDSTWETNFFYYQSLYYENISYMAHAVLSKLVPLTAFIIWFCTNKKWWYHSILPLIIMYLFQLISVVNDDTEFMDEIELFYIIPMAIVISPVLYLARKKLFNQVLLHELHKSLNNAIQNAEEKE